MDPNATLKAFWNAMADRDYDAAVEAGDDLQAWLERGGFAPADFDRRRFEAALEAACLALRTLDA